MKKSTLLLFLLSYVFSYGQETIFSETCGSTNVPSPKKVDSFSGWDNAAPITFTRTITLDGFADVRSTSTFSNHVWFPSGKSSDLIISNILTASYKNLKLSFDIAASKLTGANANNLTVYCNENLLIIPSTTFASTKFIPIADIELSNAGTMNLKFEYTSIKNTNGYRLNNFKITGEKVTSGLNNPLPNEFNVIISGKDLLVSSSADGTAVEIYNSLGSIVQTSILNSGSIKLNSNLTKGLYIVRVGKCAHKIML